MKELRLLEKFYCFQTDYDNHLIIETLNVLLSILQLQETHKNHSLIAKCFE